MRSGVDDLHELPPDTVEHLPCETVPFVQEAAPPQPPPLAITLVHGDLAFAKYPVVIGHYENDPILGSEADLDRRLQGRLSRHHQLGLYPHRARDCEFFLDRGKGAVVLGLGPVGSLTPRALEDAVRDAVLRYLMKQASGGEPGLSFLLIGSMAHVMPIEESVGAVLRGVQAANAAKPPVPLAAVEFVELWDDRVLEAAHALKGRIFETETRPGAQRRVAADDGEAAAGWWSRLRITSETTGDGGQNLRFALVTNRARTEVDVVPDPLEAAGLIRRAIESTRPEPELAEVLYEQLVPLRFEQAAASGPVLLMLDETSAAYPWELLQDRAQRGARPFAVEKGLIRQFETARFRVKTDAAPGLAAFVVGNPKTTRYPDLPGAARESEAVAAALKARGVEVEALTGQNADAIRFGLHRRPYRILHFAGHGKHGANRSAAMVIGDEALLGAAHVAKMRYVPDLVFLNCCHLGRIEPDRANQFAAGLAREFIDLGSRAVIAAGWAVDDAAAAAFATQFYQYFLGGDSFGQAVRRARADVYTAYPGVNTWGAYQCYGDPHFRLDDEAARTERIDSSPQLAFPYQLELELENLLRRAEAGTASPEWLHARWDRLKNQPVPAAWWKSPGAARLTLQLSQLAVLS